MGGCRGGCGLVCDPVDGCGLVCGPVDGCGLVCGPVDGCGLVCGPVDGCGLVCGPIDGCDLGLIGAPGLVCDSGLNELGCGLNGTRCDPDGCR